MIYFLVSYYVRKIRQRIRFLGLRYWLQFSPFDADRIRPRFSQNDHELTTFL